MGFIGLLLRMITADGRRARCNPGQSRCWRGLAGVILILIGMVSLGISTVRAQPTPNTVYSVQIRDTIDLGLAPYLERVLAQAEEANAPAVILEINTPGGRLDAALQMRDLLLESEIRTIAFVNREAFSAGALIAIAAQELYMAPGAVLGAATPVTSSGIEADAKTISAVRSTFRSTAEVRGRDPVIAEAMVDPAIAIEGLVTSGQLLTLTADEAQEWGYTDGITTDLQELLATAGLEAAALQETAPQLAENVVRFLTNPVVASLLTTFGFLLIMVDILSGGIGLASALGVGFFALFFWGHFIAGLAGWESVALALIGLIFIGLEIFVTPGFGITGLIGIVALFGSLFLALIGREIVTNADLARAGYTVLGTLLAIVIGAAIMVRYLPRFGALQGLILQSQVDLPGATPRRRRWPWLEGPRLEAHTRPAAEERPSLRGATGVALSDLRPGGIARIGGERIDVVTQGDYISAGTPIEVIADERYRRVVRRLEQAQ